MPTAHLTVATKLPSLLSLVSCRQFKFIDRPSSGTSTYAAMSVVQAKELLTSCGGTQTPGKRVVREDAEHKESEGSTTRRQ